MQRRRSWRKSASRTRAARNRPRASPRVRRLHSLLALPAVRPPPSLPCGRLLRPNLRPRQASMRFMCRGRSFGADGGPLAELVGARGGKVMVMAADVAVDEVQDGLVAALGSAAAPAVAAGERAVREAGEQLDRVERGFVEAAQRPAAAAALEKECLRVNVELERALEALDGVAVARQHERARTERKRLVLEVQRVLALNDALADRVRALQ